MLGSGTGSCQRYPGYRDRDRAAETEYVSAQHAWCRAAVDRRHPAMGPLSGEQRQITAQSHPRLEAKPGGTVQRHSSCMER